ncbi:MAG: hypothetical protein MSG64_19085 [Pyrinomonadaceae bacterium MAG19_C2-C3]|nr:hypothetical protein [Pyrinomonadaceae bacterium MAG19_C2-C3]
MAEEITVASRLLAFIGRGAVAHKQVDDESSNTLVILELTAVDCAPVISTKERLNRKGHLRSEDADDPYASSASIVFRDINVVTTTQTQSPFISLLARIDAGVQIYEPFSKTADELRGFEDTVARLREMEHLGLINKLFVQTRTSFGTERVEMVTVVGGLAEEGRRVLGEFGK